MHTRYLPIVLFAAALTTAGRAQYSTQRVVPVGIKLKVHKNLSAVPLRLGSDAMGAALRAKFIPAAEKDFIIKANTKFDWGVQVLAFATVVGPITGGAKKKTEAESEEEMAERARREFLERFRAKNFLDYVTDKDPAKHSRVFVTKGQTVNAKGKRPAYEFYEYYDEGSMRNVRGTGQETFWYYHFAAVYTLDRREVALVFRWPVFKKPKPDKLKRMGKKMIASLQLLGSKDKGVAVKASASKDKFANTPARRETLDKALENIENLKGWDYFTSQNFICFFSWDAKKPAKKPKSRQFAKTLTAQMEDVRELYLKYYPPKKKGLSDYYPVLRVCHNQDLFNSYGGTSGGVVGWFNSGSKELVIFNDVDGVYGGKRGVKTIAYHEGWHQYADSYFGDGVTLNRWFGEGTGDWFGAWTKTGSKWTYQPSMGRIRGAAGIALQVARRKHVPLRDIITWNMRRFYGPRAVYYYAQGYAMVDFFRRGKRLMGGKWNSDWDGVLDDYRKAMLEHGDQKKAIKTAFGSLDMVALEEAWILFVKKFITKK